jgi:hypothetical protein
MTASCPLCRGTSFMPVFHRARTMVSANSLYESATAARNAPAGDLTIVLCRSCGFAFNSTFDLSLVPYGEGYENDQSKSERFANHMREMAGRVRTSAAGGPLRAVEVGCGQAQFLRLVLATNPAPGDRAAGFDPSYAGGEIPGCEVYPAFFDAGALQDLGFTPNVIISRHVIEHIPEPIALLAGLRDALEQLPSVDVFFETPSIDWIFENGAFWDLCYEHCSYFTPASLRFAFEAAGFAVSSVEPVFGGQYMWISAATGRRNPALPIVDETRARDFVRATTQSQSQWREMLVKLRGEGKIAVWGAATKGATFVQDLDFDATLVDCLIDINPLKQNRFVPLTAHPVVDWRTALAGGVSTIVTTNPNYSAEIRTLIGDEAGPIRFIAL